MVVVFQSWNEPKKKKKQNYYETRTLWNGTKSNEQRIDWVVLGFIWWNACCGSFGVFFFCTNAHECLRCATVGIIQRINTCNSLVMKPATERNGRKENRTRLAHTHSYSESCSRRFFLFLWFECIASSSSSLGLCIVSAPIQALHTHSLTH